MTRRVRADFKGLFGDLLCLSHLDSVEDELGETVELHEGMQLTAYDEDVRDDGERDDLLATGIVERSPESLACIGSRWVLRIDRHGVRHESEISAAKS